jgi:hypothetical protein
MTENKIIICLIITIMAVIITNTHAQNCTCRTYGGDQGYHTPTVSFADCYDASHYGGCTANCVGIASCATCCQCCCGGGDAAVGPFHGDGTCP